MSSLDKSPDWSVFSEREVPFDVELLSPVSEMVTLLQTYRTDINKAREEVEKVQRQGLEALAQQAVFVVQMESALAQYESALAQGTLKRIHRHFRVLKDQMMDALKQAGLEVIVPLGKSFEEAADWVHVQGWRHHKDFPSELVAEVLEPVVIYQGRLIRQGRVIMGAPSEGSEHKNEKKDGRQERRKSNGNIRNI